MVGKFTFDHGRWDIVDLDTTYVHRAQVQCPGLGDAGGGFYPCRGGLLEVQADAASVIFIHGNEVGAGIDQHLHLAAIDLGGGDVLQHLVALDSHCLRGWGLIVSAHFSGEAQHHLFALYFQGGSVGVGGNEGHAVVGLTFF